MFISIKSEYNYQRSLNKIEKTIPFVKGKVSYLGVANDNSLIGSLKFISECQDNNIIPLVGVEIKLSEYKTFSNILIYAQNTEGYYNLNKLISEEIFTKNTNAQNILQDIIIKYPHLIIVFQNDSIQNIEENILELITRQMQKIKFSNYYFTFTNGLEIFNFKNKKIKEDVLEKTIYIKKPEYILETEIDSYMVMNSIYKGVPYTKEKVNKPLYKKLSLEYILKTNDDENNTEYSIRIMQNTINKFFPQFEEYNLQNTYKETLNFPEFKDINFTQLLEEKLQLFFGNNSNINTETKNNYQKRLDEELAVIQEMNFQNYFLIMKDIVDFCQNNNILYGDGRGSAPGSLVSYLLKITKIDPLKYGLYFERFLNPKRITIPDIDLDIADNRRNEVVEYLINKYSQQNVAKIMTVNKYLAKSVINDVGKAIDFEKNSLKQINEKLNSQLSFEENIKENYSFFAGYLSNAKFDFMRQVINNLEGMPKNSSIHAAGVIISAKSIYHHSSIKNEIGQNEAKYFEKYGYIKFDLLSLSTLSFLESLEIDVNNIRKHQNKKLLNLESIPLDDKNVFSNLSRGNTFGIFQLESKGIAYLLKRYKPRNITDLGIVLALYRPGPMKNIDLFLENKNHPDKIQYDHPILKEILKSTYGVIVFQEDVMNVVRKIADFTASEADMFRYAMSKKIKGEIEKQRSKFIKQGEKNNITKDVLVKIFNNIEEFAGYGFNKAHAIAYASLIYKIMFIKTYMPAVFYSTLFTVSVNSKQKEIFLDEIALYEIIIYPPNFLKSEYEHKVNEKNLLIGFKQIKGLSEIKIQKFIKLRDDYLLNNKEKFEFNNFLRSVFFNREVDFTEREIKEIIYSGCFSTISLNIKMLETELIRLSGIIEFNPSEKIEFNQIEDYNYNEKNILEEEALGFNIYYSNRKLLLKNFQKQYPKQKIVKLPLDLNNLMVYQKIFVLAKYKYKKEIVTKNNERMAFYKFEIQLNEYELVCFPSSYQKISRQDQNLGLVVLEIFKNKESKLILEDLIK